MTSQSQALPRWLIWAFAFLVLVLVIVWTGVFRHRQYVRGIDERIVIEVERILAYNLNNPSEYHQITKRYGKFIELTNVRWIRSQRSIGPMGGSISWGATAKFEKAQARISLEIYRGETLSIQQLKMWPTEEWVQFHPALAGKLVIIENEIWFVSSGKKLHSMIVGKVSHPDFFYE